jgi:hypothetical protein
MTSVEWLVCSQIPDVILTMKVYIKSILYHVLTAFVLTVVLVIRDFPPHYPSMKQMAISIPSAYCQNNIVISLQVLFHDGSLLHSMFNTQLLITINNSSRILTHV